VQTSYRPVWTDEALTLAEAIRKHQHDIRVGPAEGDEGDAAYVVRLDYLRQEYGHLISILPADHEAAVRGQVVHQEYAEHRSRQARLNARIAAVPVPAGVVGASLYQAIDAYAERAVEQTAKESGKVEAGNARRLKSAIHDMDLGEFGYTAMERIARYWASRPEAMSRGGKGSGKPISVTTVDNHLSTARRFARWLDRSDAFGWELPRHGLDALKVNLKRLRTNAEVGQRRHGVKVFTPDQLTVLYRHATDFERLLVLLGLNAAMAQAEILTLRQDEVEGDTIKRIRRKSGVYAEFKLWPETQQALAWWQRVRETKGELVMLTDRGQPYTRQRISNAWSTLRKRVERNAGQDPEWWLPFKHLRKTAAQLVREAADGEVAGVFLSHGQPVVTDELADAYSNRPFDKVAEALSTAHEQLVSMYDAAPEAFTATSIGKRMPRRG
jgi:integrase